MFMRFWRLLKWLKELLGLRRRDTTFEVTTIKTTGQAEITIKRETRGTD